MTPYDYLGIDSNADDKTVRNAYLELIKKYPPDRDPERFKEIANAYETIKDEKKRLEYYLFNTDVPIERPFEALMLHIRQAGKRKPPSFERLKEILRNG